MKFTEQEWMHIEDLQSMDDEVAALPHGQQREELEDVFWQKLEEWFPWLDDPIEVLLQVYPAEEDDLVVREVLEEAQS